MQIGLSQLILPREGMGRFFELASDNGYEVVEICLRREGDLTLETDEAARRKIIEQAAASGVKIVSMTHSHVMGNLLGSGEAQEQGVWETVAGLEMAASMGVGCTLHTLGRMEPDLYYEQAYRNAVQSLREIAEAAERLGVVMAVEFIWNGFAFSPLEWRRLLEEVGSEHIGFYFDPGNMAVFQYPHHWLSALGRHTKMVHMKDWQGRALNGGWTPLLAGEVDFGAIMRELRQIDYDGPLIREVPPNTARLDETAKAIRQIMEM